MLKLGRYPPPKNPVEPPYVPGVGFSVAGLDRAKFGLNRFQSFLFIVVIAISILLKTF